MPIVALLIVVTLETRMSLLSLRWSEDDIAYFPGFDGGVRTGSNARRQTVIRNTKTKTMMIMVGRG